MVRLIESFQKRDFGPLGFIIILILALIISLLAFKSRNDQWNVWSQNKEITFFNQSPLLSTADGPYFLDVSKSINMDKSISSNMEKRFFPEFNKEYRKKHNKTELSEPSFFEISLLPISINFFSKQFDSDLLKTGNSIIPYAAFLTALSIALFFIILGFGFEGTIAGLGASLSQSIYVRTSVGRVDTDLLNAGFFYSILTLIFLSVISKDKKSKIFFISLCGLVNFLFTWWYQHPGFLFPFLITIILLQFLYKTSFKISLLQIVLFVTFSGPSYVMKSIYSINSFIDEFLRFGPSGTPTKILNFPDTFQTVTELQTLDFFEYFKTIIGQGNEWVGIIGIIGLILFILLNYKKSVVLFSAIIFLLMSIFIAKRFAIYAIPLYWFGFSYLLISLINYFSTFINFKGLNDKFFNFLISTSTAIFLIVICVINSLSMCENSLFINCKPKYIPKPSFSSDITEAFYSLNSENFDRKSVIVTWWDYGYWVNFFSGLSTVHDGGSQRSPKTYLVANSLTSTSMKKSYNIINYVVSSDLEKVNQDSEKGYDNFLKKISNSNPINRPVYLFLSRDIIRWWSSITYIGNWDVITGSEKNKTTFESIDCVPKSQIEMQCGDSLLNVNTGSISNGNQLDKLIITQNGKIIRDFDYKNKKGKVSMIIEIFNNKRFFYVVHPKTLESTFSKLFFQGTTDDNFFKLVQDGYPLYRVFEIKR